MNIKIYSTKNFKKGDTVWFCNFELQPSGRVKNNFRPQTVTIKEVQQEFIEIDGDSGYGWYCLSSSYYIDQEESNLRFGDYDYNNSLGLHISFTKEEAEEKYNKMIEDAIESWYQKFKRTENTLRRQLI